MTTVVSASHVPAGLCVAASKTAIGRLPFNAERLA